MMMEIGGREGGEVVSEKKKYAKVHCMVRDSLKPKNEVRCSSIVQLLLLSSLFGSCFLFWVDFSCTSYLHRTIEGPFVSWLFLFLLFAGTCGFFYLYKYPHKYEVLSESFSVEAASSCLCSNLDRRRTN